MYPNLNSAALQDQASFVLEARLDISTQISMSMHRPMKLDIHAIYTYSYECIPVCPVTTPRRCGRGSCVLFVSASSVYVHY